MRLLTLICPLVKEDPGQVEWHTLAILALGSLRQDELEFRQSYKGRPPYYPTPPEHRSCRSKLRATDHDKRPWAQKVTFSLHSAGDFMISLSLPQALNTKAYVKSA